MTPSPTVASHAADATVARSLTWRYAIALTLIALLSSAAWVSLNLVISEQASTAAVVNVSGRQRMLSQRTALFSNLLVQAPPQARDQVRQQLKEAADLLARSHDGLTQGNAAMGLPTEMSPAVQALYFTGAAPLDAQVRSYLGALSQLLAEPDARLTPTNPYLLQITQTATGELVQALDAMVQLYQQEGEASVARLQRTETWLWLLTLVLLALEAALIFQPFARHVKRVIGKLQAATKELQQYQNRLESLVDQRTQELKQRSQALAESEEKFRLICTAAQDGIVIIDADDKLVYWNPAAQAMFGYSDAELAGQSVHGLLVPAQLSRLAATGLQAFKASGEGAAVGKRWQSTGVRRSGQSFPIELTISGVKLKHSWHGLGIIRDITEQQRIESELRIAATAFDAQMGMTITDANAIILRVNRAFTQITGYSAEEVIGKTPHVLSSGRYDDLFYRTMYQSIADTGMWAGEIWNRHKDGELYPEWLTITAVKNESDQITHYVAAFSDISERKAAETQIRNLAFYDPLTNLPNRRLLMDRLELAMAAGSRHQHISALLFIDLDNFKTVNDTLGHQVGDQLLLQVAQRLTSQVRAGDTVARLGGDEFVVMLEDLSDNVTEAAALSETVGHKILQALRAPYDLAPHNCRSTASIGVALFSDLSESMDELLKRADLSMYQAKASGRNTLRFFDPEVQAAVQASAELEVALRQGIAQQQLVLHFQAQVTREGVLAGAEALVRWQHPERGLIGPVEFIALAEQTGLILPLGDWVLGQACRQLALWAQNPALAGLMLAVNVSALQFRQTHFVASVLEVLAHTGANPHCLKLELTESLLVDDLDDVIAKMSALKAQGVGFSLDDFGTGYASLAYLSRLPLDQLKIDQSFVRDIGRSSEAEAICAATISLAHSLKMKVVAEGVETPEQQHFLGTLHPCDQMQGYLFGRPLPLVAFERQHSPGTITS